MKGGGGTGRRQFPQKKIVINYSPPAKVGQEGGKLAVCTSSVSYGRQKIPICLKFLAPFSLSPSLLSFLPLPPPQEMGAFIFILSNFARKGKGKEGGSKKENLDKDFFCAQGEK